jgi:cytochrome b561
MHVTFFQLHAPEHLAESWRMDRASCMKSGGTLAQILIAIHVLAALKHQFIDKDGLMRRMMFR